MHFWEKHLSTHQTINKMGVSIMSRLYCVYCDKTLRDPYPTPEPSAGVCKVCFKRLMSDVARYKVKREAERKAEARLRI